MWLLQILTIKQTHFPRSSFHPVTPPAMCAPFHGSADGHFVGTRWLFPFIQLLFWHHLSLGSHHSSQLWGRYMCCILGRIFILCVAHTGDQRFSRGDQSGGMHVVLFGLQRSQQSALQQLHSSFRQLRSFKNLITWLQQFASNSLHLPWAIWQLSKFWGWGVQSVRLWYPLDTYPFRPKPPFMLLTKSNIRPESEWRFQHTVPFLII